VQACVSTPVFKAKYCRNQYFFSANPGMDYLYQLAPFSDTSAEATSTTEQANTESVKETLADVQNVLFTFVSGALSFCYFF